MYTLTNHTKGIEVSKHETLSEARMVRDIYLTKMRREKGGDKLDCMVISGGDITGTKEYDKARELYFSNIKSELESFPSK